MKILIIDTETANSVEQPLPYDIGYNIYDTDTDKVLIKRSFVVAEIYLDRDLMNTAYYAEKIPRYEIGLKNGSRQMKKLLNIRKQIIADMKEHDCNIVGAYNLGFDKKASNNDCRLITCSSIRWFFPYGTKWIDIWTMACTSFMRSVNYIKWALKNGQVSDKGNIKTSAEVAYRYLTKNIDFEEEHTGLEDVEIETEIFKKVFNGRMKYETEIIPNPWRIPQKARKEWEEKQK